MGQFDRQIATALKLIKKNGQKVEWKQYGQNAPDSAQPWNVVSDIEVTYQPYICFLPIDRDGKEFLVSLGRSEAVAGSMYGLMGAQPFSPNLKDTVMRDGVPLDIDSIEVLSPNGQIILYTLMING